MTEIPEHLLKRSRDRRSALGLGGDDAGGATSAEAKPPATPATTGDAAPAASAPAGPAGRKAAAAPAAPPPPKPDPPYVAAARSRPKVPYWAMGALSLLPIWMFMYVRAVTEPPEVVEGPLALGAEDFGGCASCHLADGGGAVGRQLNGGEVLLTFPHIEDQIRFVLNGSDRYKLAGVEVPGDPDREGGPHPSGAFGVMPPQGAEYGGEYTDVEVLGLVCHERYALPGNADPESEEWAEEFTNWCSPDAPIYQALEEGQTFATLGEEPIMDEEGNPIEIIPIGEEPAPGTPAGE